jgi:hypothetical protein
MAHGYLGDGYGSHGEIDPDRGDDRDFRGRGPGRDRGMMWGARDRSWRGERNERWPQDRWPEQRGRADSYNRQSEDWSGQHRYSANPDDHYRSWRDRHMGELDRDYADYCREREEQFHREFDGWRRQKYGNPQPLRTGMTNSGISHDPSGMTQAAEDSAPDEPRDSNPTAAATLGTNSGRSRSRG